MTPEEQRIQDAAMEIMGAILPQEDMDAIQVYQMEQHERAQELYESAVGDGVNFATTDESGDVFVNTKWLGMVARTLAEAIILDTGEPNRTAFTAAEVLGQTIIAAKKFVGQ